MQLYYYHAQVMIELIKRNVNIDCKWFDPIYRGKNCEEWQNIMMIYEIEKNYPEHNTLYFAECILNLMSARKKDSSRKNKVLNPALDGKMVMR